MRPSILFSIAFTVLLGQMPAAAASLMRIQTVPTDLNLNPINSVAVGEQYQLLVYATDIRDPVATFSGVFAAGTNVLFDPSLSTLDVNQTVVFGSFFNFQQDSVLSPGSAIGWAATASLSPPGNAPQFLFSVVLTATAVGQQTFSPNFDTLLSHENLLYELNGEVPPEQVEFLGSSLQIVPEPSSCALAAMGAAALLFARRRKRSTGS